MHLTVTLLLPLAVFFGDVSGSLERYLRETQDPLKSIPKSRALPSTHWIEQRLDHFNPTDNRTWQMRYFSNDEHFKPGGPIGIHVGGEWTISTSALITGQTYDIAQQNNGYLFYTEHRFFGESHPTPDASTQNLKYLSMDQALADLAYFVEYVKRTIPGLENSKVYMVGGSYAGSMVAWFRLKYPHLVDAALASSAVIRTYPEVPDYYEVVGKGIKEYGGQRCYEILEKGTEQLLEVIKEKDGAEKISKMFNLCKEVDPSSSLDFGWFMSDVMGHFALMAQYHVTGEFEYYCNKIVKFAENETELYGLAKFIEEKSSDCHNMKYEDSVEVLRETDWDKIISENVRQWVYLVCAGYGNYPTDASKNQPFSQGINNLDLYISFCRDLFGEEFTTNSYPIFYNGVDHYIMTYGSLNLNVTRVIFTQGTIDPWHPSGLLEDLNEEAPTIVITGASHVQDIESIHPTDSEEMKAAKQRVLDLMAKWLNE